VMNTTIESQEKFERALVRNGRHHPYVMS
jgi:hypothetical protein